MVRGYWLKDDIQIDVSRSGHLDAILENPRLFGTTGLEVEGAYLHHGEPMGYHGMARLEILRNAILDHDFILVEKHHFPAPYWLFEFADFSSSELAIRSFMWWADSLGLLRASEDIELSGLADGHRSKKVYRNFLRETTLVG